VKSTKRSTLQSFNNTFDMAKAVIPHIATLLERISVQGIGLAAENGNIKLTFRKGQEIDQELLNEIRNHKESILEHFNTFEKPVIIDQVTGHCQPVVVENTEYYEITPTQLYWVDETKDREYKELVSSYGTICFSYIVKGLNIEIFGKALQELVTRHESLRCTFHCVGNRYLMKVHAPDELPAAFQITYIDAPGELKTRILDELENFKNQRLSTRTGPLLQSRIIPVKENEYVLSFKLHHVVSDTWSNGVLIRELFKRYSEIANGEPATWKPLKFQFKEYLAYINRYRDRYKEEHRKYWEQLFQSLPPELILPYTIHGGLVNTKDRRHMTQHIHFPDPLRKQLQALASRFNTTLFIILQASFTSYLYYKTGINDILAGTHVSGRDYPESYDQIGCYARTEIIRTVFDRDESYAGAIEKTIQSNFEMVTYRAYTLTDAINALLPAGTTYSKFWKVNFHFVDNGILHASENVKNIFADGAPLQLEPIVDTRRHSSIQLDLILKFIKTAEQLSVGIHYDRSVFIPEQVTVMIQEYLSFTGKMVNDLSQLIYT
jgi:hypothetical protein